ncbi:FHA domain-containing protein [Micrococcales bacterium 31B]|nr:FHA domain-containing protein [Micrococcales bacterium 31B]
MIFQTRYVRGDGLVVSRGGCCVVVPVADACGQAFVDALWVLAGDYGALPGAGEAWDIAEIDALEYRETVKGHLADHGASGFIATRRGDKLEVTRVGECAALTVSADALEWNTKGARGTTLPCDEAAVWADALWLGATKASVDARYQSTQMPVGEDDWDIEGTPEGDLIAGADGDFAGDYADTLAADSALGDTVPPFAHRADLSEDDLMASTRMMVRRQSAPRGHAATPTPESAAPAKQLPPGAVDSPAPAAVATPPQHVPVGSPGPASAGPAPASPASVRPGGVLDSFFASLPAQPAGQAQSAFGQPVYGQPVPGQPVPGQPVPGQPVPGQPQPSFSHPSFSQPAYGQPAPGQPHGQGYPASAASASIYAPGPEQFGIQSPHVSGSACARGHLNPPHRADCRVCRLPVVPVAEAFPRPALGTLFTEGIDPIVVRGNVIFGRKPFGDRFGRHEQPLLVAVNGPSNDISRNHVLISVEQWHVFVSDLDSTNGTLLHRAGYAPRRLIAHEQVMLRSGDIIDLGDGVTIRCQDIP